MKKKKKITAIQYIVLGIIALAFIIPMLWLVLASVDPSANASLSMPETPSLENYLAVFTDADNLRGFANSFYMSMITSVVTVAVSMLAAYPLSRYKLRGKTKFLYIILFMTSLPINAILVPVFKMFITFNMQDSLVSISLFMAATNLPYGIWMTKNFMDSVPVTLEEAAKVDGAGAISVLKKIIMPLMKPGIFTVLIYVFTGVWGNFFTPFILLQSSEKYPASVRIYQYFQDGGMIEYGRLAAYSVIYMIPCVVLYIFAQKFMSKGFALGGADKG